MAAIILLLATFAAIRARFGTLMADAVGLTGVAFVPDRRSAAAGGGRDGARLPRRIRRRPLRPLSCYIPLTRSPSPV